jgi:hypothetical protein
MGAKIPKPAHLVVEILVVIIPTVQAAQIVEALAVKARPHQTSLFNLKRQKKKFRISQTK